MISSRKRHLSVTATSAVALIFVSSTIDMTSAFATIKPISTNNAGTLIRPANRYQNDRALRQSTLCMSMAPTRPETNNEEIHPSPISSTNDDIPGSNDDLLLDKIMEKVDSFDPTELHFGEQQQQQNEEEVNEKSGLGSTVLHATDVVMKENEVEHQKIGIWLARGLLLVVAMLWGTNFASVKYLEKLCFHPPCVHPPSEAAFARFALAGLVGIRLLINQRKDVILAGMECGLFISFGYITQALALQSIGAGECAFICSLTVVVVPLLSALFFGKPIKPVHIVSAIVALTGVGVLEGLVDIDSLLGLQPALADPSTTTDIVTVSSSIAHSGVARTADIAASTTSNTLASAATGIMTQLEKAGIGKGDLLALGQPFGFGFAFMRIEHYVEKFEDVENRVLTISAAQCLVVGLMSLLWVLYDYNWVLPNFEYMIEPHRIVAILWTGIMTTVVAIFLEGVALQTASATEAALTFASEPVWASIFGAWLLKEQLDINSYVGGAVILVACLLGAIADLPSSSTDVTTGSSESEL